MLKKIFTNPIVVSVLLVIVTYFYLQGQTIQRERYEVAEHLFEIELLKDEYADRIEDVKTELLQDLENCETGGVPEAKRWSFIKEDTNGLMSIGGLQLQRETIVDIYARRMLGDMDMVEATALAMNEERAYKFAEYVIFELGEIERWYICSEKLGLEERVELINKISK